METKITRMIAEHVEVSQQLGTLTQHISQAAALILQALRQHKTIFVMGNGGSASQASHFSAELVGRYKKERKGYPCIALTTDTSAITAIGNDYGFENIFSRQLEALAQKDDVVIGLSTSGTSPNVLLGLEQAKKMGCKTITLTGKDGGKMKQADVNIHIPSQNTARIQEMHLTIIHMLCELVEGDLT